MRNEGVREGNDVVSGKEGGWWEGDSVLGGRNWEVKKGVVGM